MSHQLFALSPLDGRYKAAMGHLPVFFSEAALMQYRLKVEVEYLIALSDYGKIPRFPKFSEALKKRLRLLVTDFGIKQAEEVKEIEAETNHDVKAIEYYLFDELKNLKLFPESALSFIHFALTSEDVNNLSYAMMIRDALNKEIFPVGKSLISTLHTLAKQWKKVPMLSLTHGQPATPTTVGKELMVFVKRLERQGEILKSIRIMGKFSGATGNFSAQSVAVPTTDWMAFSKRFIRSLKLEPNLHTTQIESHDWNAELFDTIARINVILISLSRDCWMMISRGIFSQKVVGNEVGSSTMPHKVNPIDFENAEGNLGLSNTLFDHFANKLPRSRLQRDLSDSTVMRNLGVAFAYSMIAYQSIAKGNEKLQINARALQLDLTNNWEVLAEAIQTVMRRYQVPNAYEQMRDLTRGHGIDRDKLTTFIQSLTIPKDAKQRLLDLTPETYTGLATLLVKAFS